jgi:hypothetical protein
MKTTLNKIREFQPCADGWAKLLKTLNKSNPDDEPLSILQVLDSNGLDDALWCLRAVNGYDKEIRLFAVFCARQVEHLMTDQRSKDALKVAERFANGEATKIELDAARAAAAAAAARSAGSAYGAAAGAAEAAAAAAAAWVAAWAAAEAAEAAAAAAYRATEAAARAAGAAAEAAQEKEFRRILTKLGAAIKLVSNG